MTMGAVHGMNLVAAAMAVASGSIASGNLVTNGGFESGLSGWAIVDQVGSDGGFFSQSGAASPLNGFSVAAPVAGTRAAMSDAGAGGSHVLFQDFTVPLAVTSASVEFSLYINNGAGVFFTPPTLDWAATNPAGGTNLNQQARVDIVLSSANPFAIDASSVLANLFQTSAQTAPVFGYTPFSFDLTSLFSAHAGETLRLRFAEVDNVNFFNMGVDGVAVNVVPAPASVLVFCGVAAMGRRGRR